MRKNNMEKVIIIGGGPAGMMASIRYAERGFDVTLLEKNEKLGKKLFITGKGRCNLTNDCSEETFFENVMSNPKFLFSAYHALSAQDTMALFGKWGLALKVERGNRVFPVSDHSYDVTDTLKKRMKALGVKVFLNTRVDDIVCKKKPDEQNADNQEKAAVKSASSRKPTSYVTGVKAGHRFFEADRVLIATGGLSYPVTGSTGDGLKWAGRTGHRVTDCLPSLVAMNASDYDVATLSGLSLKNVTFSISRKKKLLFSGFGEMMFTHFGITGPLVLTASAAVGSVLKKEELTGYIDLKPRVDESRLDADLLRLFEDNANKNVSHAIRSLYPLSIVPVILDRGDIPADKKVHDITKAERIRIREVTKKFAVHLTGLRGFEEAIVTRGGVSVRDVDPATMESKKVEGLYFAGEVLDLDALTGGFNLQVAWSTAYAAANA